MKEWPGARQGAAFCCAVLPSCPGYRHRVNNDHLDRVAGECREGPGTCLPSVSLAIIFIAQPGAEFSSNWEKLPRAPSEFPWMAQWPRRRVVVPAMGWARTGVFAQAGHVASQISTEALLAETKGKQWVLGSCGVGWWHKGPIPSRVLETIKDTCNVQWGPFQNKNVQLPCMIILCHTLGSLEIDPLFPLDLENHHRNLHMA